MELDILHDPSWTYLRSMYMSCINLQPTVKVSLTKVGSSKAACILPPVASLLNVGAFLTLQNSTNVTQLSEAQQVSWEVRGAVGGDVSPSSSMGIVSNYTTIREKNLDVVVILGW